MQEQWKGISLFAGAGGCSLGFSWSDVNIIAAYDIFQDAISTYNRNLGQNKCKCLDLANCDFESVRNGLGLRKGEIDILIGGPPCQGFTTAGPRFWDDPRNKLVINYANALAYFKPRWFVMENVEGILTTAQGTYLIETIKKMVSLGYSVFLKKVYMQAYGIPQRRKRVILVGNMEGKAFSFPKETEWMHGGLYRNTRSTLRKAIEDLEEVINPEIDQIPHHETGIKQKRIDLLKPGQTMKDLPQALQHKSFLRRSQRRVADGTPTEKRGGAPSGLKRLIYDEPSLTITSAAVSEFVHPTKNRNLTIRECARIQTFPDNFIFVGNNITKMKQIGNAIPPLFAHILANKIKDCDQGEGGVLQPGLISYDVTKSNGLSPALQRTCRELETLCAIKQKQLILQYD